MVSNAHRDGLKLEDLQQAGAAVTRSLAGPRGEEQRRVPLCAVVQGGGGGGPRRRRPPRQHAAGLRRHRFQAQLPGLDARLYEQLKKKQVALLDAPMTGTPVHANAGELNLMIGGTSRCTIGAFPSSRRWPRTSSTSAEHPRQCGETHQQLPGTGLQCRRGPRRCRWPPRPGWTCRRCSTWSRSAAATAGCGRVRSPPSASGTSP